jgi:group I intron endonuclease
MVEKKFNFIYKTTNLVNGKFYIGQHSTNNLDDNYLGSGDYLKKDIRELGKLKFKREILEYCDFKDLSIREKFWITELNAKNIGYNKYCSGCGGFISEETYNKFSETYRGRKNMPEQAIKCIESKIKNGTLKHREESKRKTSLSVIKAQLDPELRKKFSHPGENNPFYGQHHSEETKRICSEKAKNRPRFPCEYCGKLVTKQSNKQFHLEKCKFYPNKLCI